MRALNRYLLVKQTHSARAARRLNRLRSRKRTAAGLIAVIGLALAAFIFAVTAVYVTAVAGLPNPAQLEAMLEPEQGILLQPTRLYDRSGEHIIASLENFNIQRRYLSIDPQQAAHIDPLVVHTYVALHDPGYWQDPALRWDRLFVAQPQSISERLVDDLLLWQEPAGWQKSLRMHLLAAQVLREYGRTQVLEWHLNSVYFGHLAYGVDSAARLYLGKPATHLTLAEASILAAVAQTPALNPQDSPAAVLELQPLALERMRAAGQISQADYENARKAVLEFAAPVEPPDPLAQAFTNLVVQELGERFDRRWIERGGLRIVTSLDIDLQSQMKCLIKAQLARTAGEAPLVGECPAAQLLPTLIDANASRLAASAVLLDNRSGQVLAMVGDQNLTGEGQTLSRHIAGTLLSPVAAVSGFARGMGPASLMWDIPPAGEPGDRAAGASRYHGPVRLRTALANDYTQPFENLVEQIGRRNVNSTAVSLGLDLETTASDADLYFNSQATPLELAQVYSIFASLGLRTGQNDPLNSQIEPVLILSVSGEDGEVYWDNYQPVTQAVLSSPLAFLVHHMLSDEPARWPALGYPNALEIGRPAGAKAGLVTGGESAWAAGYTAAHTAVVWMGSEPGSAAEVDAVVPAGIWHALLQYSSHDLPADNWLPPAGVTFLDVCDPSGLLPTSDCPTVVNEVFTAGNEPVAYDNLYKAFQVNRETGMLATVFTPPERVEELVYLVVPPEAETWARLTGLPVPPQSYDLIQAGSTSPDVRLTTPEPFSYVHGQVSVRGTAGGDGFSSYRLQVGQGLNPQAWIQIGGETTRPVNNGLLGEWDTSGEDGLYALRLLVLRDDFSVESAVIQVTVDNTPPLARILYPLEGEVIDSGSRSTVTLQASAEDTIGIERLEWWIDGSLVGENVSEPFALIWDMQPGQHSLQVRATDLAGNETRSEVIAFDIR